MLHKSDMLPDMLPALLDKPLPTKSNLNMHANFDQIHILYNCLTPRILPTIAEILPPSSRFNLVSSRSLSAWAVASVRPPTSKLKARLESKGQFWRVSRSGVEIVVQPHKSSSVKERKRDAMDWGRGEPMIDSFVVALSKPVLQTLQVALKPPACLQRFAISETSSIGSSVQFGVSASALLQGRNCRYLGKVISSFSALYTCNLWDIGTSVYKYVLPFLRRKASLRRSPQYVKAWGWTRTGISVIFIVVCTES